jgi:pimeloyl-ACP methyl ester carboxylesterase
VSRLLPTLLLGFAALAAALPEPAAAQPSLALAPCRIEHPSGTQSVGAECGELRVPEDPSRPDGRDISLRVARVPAISVRKRPDPLFVLAGGPGMAATDFYVSVAPVFARIRRDRDIVLVDQRGTGRSNPLRCELDDQAMMEASLDVVAVATKRCLEQLDRRSDVRFYTTSVAVRDLEAVRAALGYERINLYGVSYGTRVAQHYLRRYPRNVRAVVLDGVVAPQTVLGPALALDAEGSLQRILTRCTLSPECKARFGDPRADYRALRAMLAEQPVKVTLPDPQTGAPRTIDFGPQQLATVLRLQSYSDAQAALMPLSLNLARRDGNFQPLASQFLVVTASVVDSIAYGMHNSVACSEDVAMLDVASLDRRALESTYMGATQLDALLTSCRDWPRGVVDPDLHAPLKATVPALLLSGTADQVTPPQYADAAALAFADRLHLVLPGLGHGQLTAPCIDRVMAAFLERGTARDLDVSCTRRIEPLPFFTSLAGPPP